MAVLGVVGSERIYPSQDVAELIRRKASENGIDVGKMRTEDDFLYGLLGTLSNEEFDTFCDEIERIKTLK